MKKNRLELPVRETKGGWNPPKTAVFMLCFFMICVSTMAHTFSQTLSLKMENATLEEVLLEIQERTSYDISTGSVQIENVKGLSFDFSNATVQQVLDHCLAGTNLAYSINNGVISVYQRQQPSQPARISVRVIVFDDRGEPLFGASVWPDSAPSAGNSTGIDGSIRLNIPAAEKAMTVSFLGMVTEHIELRSGVTEYTVRMKRAEEAIDEIVVTGIFERPRESYTGAVTHISAKELSNAGNINLITQIRNIDPSFIIAENNNWGSNPNRLPDIQLRGNTSLTALNKEYNDPNEIFRDEKTALANTNQPLFILDGFEVSLRQIMDLNPNIVESVTLLKDASATALYGSRGANGIMVVTTKKPEKGRLRVTYRGDITISAPDLTSYNLMNASEKIAYEVAAGLYSYDVPGHQINANKLYSKRMAEILRGVDTYWLKYPVRVGVGNKHSLRLDGGAENILYGVNVNYTNVLGTMKDTKRNTLSGDVFLQYEWKNISFQNTLSYTSNNAYESPYGSFSKFAALNPYLTPYEDDGSLKTMLEYYYKPGMSELIPVGNPLYDALLPYRDDSSYDLMRNNLAITWKICEDLSLRGRFQVTKESGRKDKYISAKHSYFAQYEAEDYKKRGTYILRTNNSFNWEADATLNYKKMLAEKHQLHAGLNFSIAESKSENNTFEAQGFIASQVYSLGSALMYKENSKPATSDSHIRRFGLTGNVNYTYDTRYYADLSAKTEGSSIFGADNKLGTFWTAGMGWNMHNEEFIRNTDLIDNLRLRASYGTSGSVNFNPYQARTTFQYHTDIYQIWGGAYMKALGNNDLKWQRTKQFNVGIDLAFLANRIRLSADYYDKLTDGVLMDINVPISAGFRNYKANLGEVSNRGYEISASAFIIRDTERNISWQVGASILHNSNKVIKISDALDAYNNQILNDQAINNDRINPSYLVKEGESLNTIYAVKSLGIDPSTGKELFLTPEGDPTFEWRQAYKVACGVQDPKLWGNINTTFRYKQFTLNVIFSYKMGGHTYNQTLLSKVENVDPWSNVDKRVYSDRWRKPGDHARFKGIQYYYDETQASSRFVMKENTFECRSINLSYEFDHELVSKIGLGSLSLSAYSDDIFRLSTIKMERGTIEPFARQFSFSISATF